MKLTQLTFTFLLIAGPSMAFPDDLEDAFQSLKDAESKKDAAQVKKFAAEASALARQLSLRGVRWRKPTGRPR